MPLPCKQLEQWLKAASKAGFGLADFALGWINVGHGLLPWPAPCQGLLCWWQSWGLLLKKGVLRRLGREKRVRLDRMELTVERVGLEGSLELWTLERDHTRYVTLDRGCGRSAFSPASFEAMQVTAAGKSLPGK